MKRYIPLSLAGLLLACQVSAYAAVTPAAIQAAINRAKVLPAGTGLSVNVSKNQASVSTYRNTKANEKDCKIDAVMIAKTIMDLSPEEIINVTVYFYNRSDLSAYDQVTLSSGDIKAFGSGELSKEQFLSSVKLEHHESEDAARISNYIQASQRRMARRPAEAKFEGDAVRISVDMESWVPARDIQYEALRIAQKVLNSNPGNPVKTVSVTFSDPDGQLADRQVIFSNADDIRGIDSQLTNALASLSLSRGIRAALDNTEGPLQDARKEMGKRITSLKIAGGDASAIESEFTAMQQAARDENETKIKARLKKLDEEIIAAEKAIKPVAVNRSQNATAVTAPELKAAIESAHILAPGTSTTVAIKENEAVVATYKAEIANEKDCKIDSILIAKTIMDEAPSNVTSVTVYFYGRNDLSSYEEIRLSAGDVKAFATGQLTKDQLLASLKMEHKKTEDSARIASAIESSEGAGTARTAQAFIRGNSVEVNVQMPSWVSDSDAKYEALRIAEKVFEANKGKSIQSVKVVFLDPEFQIGNREVNVSSSALPVLESSLTSVLTPVALVQPGEKGTDVADGPLKEERQKIKARIAVLKVMGVGVGSFENLFNSIEAYAVAGDQAAVANNLPRLANAIDTQEKAIKALKTKNTGTAAVATASAPPVTIAQQPVESRWCMEVESITDGRLLADPEHYFEELSATVYQRSPKVDDRTRRLYHGLRYFAQKLHLAAAEAQKSGDAEGSKYLQSAQFFDRKVLELLQANAAKTAQKPK